MRDIRDLRLGIHIPPSPEDVRSFEKHFGVSLPVTYVDLLTLINGGTVFGVDTFDYTLADGRVIRDGGCLGFFLPLLPWPDDEEGVWWNTVLLRGIFEEAGLNTDVVAIGVDGSTNRIFLDTSRAVPPVHIHYRASDNSTPKAADSFEQFIDSLHRPPGSKRP